ncbi:MAG: substrate-binding domain-containing protein [Planctomycetaceae bacterium]|nr:substrate-binding domain-containing protein [Planctomycetaceae bacterium]
MSASTCSKSPLKVGILVHASQEHMRQVALGVVHYTQVNSKWQVEGDGFHPLVPWNRLKQWDGDGLVAIVNTREQLKTLIDLDVPFVLAGSRIIDNRYPVVASDNVAIGRIAAEHLIECGFRRLVFLGQTIWDDERQRLEGFQESVQKRGIDFCFSDMRLEEYFVRDSSAHYRINIEKLVARLAEFEPPFAVFCPNSVIARGLIKACNIGDWNIPDEVGIIGVNDDPLECESISPSISTVAQQSRLIGFRACQLLNEIFTKNKKNEQIFLDPQGVVARRSTDVLLVGDQNVEKAMRFIRDHVQQGIGIEEVVAAVGISRRSLEIKFRQCLNRTPLSELNRVRIAKARELLRYTDNSITSIALGSGFGSSQSFCVAFKKASGCSPTEFRASHSKFD